MRSRTGTVRRLVSVLVASAVPVVVGVSLPAQAAPSVNISISDASVTEGNSGRTNATFTISATGKLSSATVQWATVSGTASSGSDFVAASGQATLSRAVKKATVTVKINGDLLDEPDETFSVLLSGATGGTITDGTGVGTITDDDAVPTLSATDGSAPESAGTVDVAVSLSTASGRAVTVDYATADDTALAGSDYTATSGTLTFAPGETSQVVALDILDDMLDETDEALFFTISSPTSATIADPSSDVSIMDDDDTPAASVGDIIVDEASQTASFEITFSGPSASTMTIDYATADGTALAGEDYSAASGTATLLSGETSATVDVSVADDGVDEPTQSFKFQLSNATNATIDDAEATASIQDDDGGPWVSVTSVKTSESSGTLLFTLTLDGASQQDVSVDYATANGTALAGSDYTATSGTASFPAGETQVEVAVPVLDDSLYEAAETFQLVLSNASGLTIDSASTAGTLTSDDKAPTSLTLRVFKGKTGVKASGRMTYAKAGQWVRVTLQRRANGSWRKVSGKTLLLSGIRDRNGDGVKEGLFKASFERQKPGSYRIKVLFKSSSTHKGCKAQKDFKI